MDNVRPNRVEVKMLKPKRALVIHILHDSFPVWILSLEVRYVSALHFSSVSSLTALIDRAQSSGYSTKLLMYLLSQWSTSSITFGTLTSTMWSKCDITLISGTMSFVVDKLQSMTSPTLAVVDHHFLGRIRNGRPSGTPLSGLSHVFWHRIRHTSTGGATEYVLLAGVVQLDTYAIPQITDLR
jgi:hypothetical protein